MFISVSARIERIADVSPEVQFFAADKYCFFIFALENPLIFKLKSSFFPSKRSLCHSYNFLKHDERPAIIITEEFSFESLIFCKISKEF